MVFTMNSRAFLWVSYGFPMGFLWLSYGFPMAFLWVSYGFPVNFPTLGIGHGLQQELNGLSPGSRELENFGLGLEGFEDGTLILY